MKNLTFAGRWNADVIDAQYQQWLENPESIDREWQIFFEGFELASGKSGKNGGSTLDDGELTRAPAATDSDQPNVEPKLQARVIGAIYAYRDNGHTQAAINPLHEPVPNPRLTLERLGFSQGDLGKEFDTGNYLGGVTMRLDEILNRLNTTYCGPIGVEYLHIQESPKRRWLQGKMEPSNNIPTFSKEKKLRVLKKLYEAEIFEKYLHTRFVGQKRFSLEGGETAINSLDAIIESFPEFGGQEIVMGMAHRGRLNVLANIMRKSYRFIFNEFSENYIPNLNHGDGDVKYHLGYDTVKTTSSGAQVEIRLAANPSHLEAVDGVVQGKARARQRIRGDIERKSVVPILIHGDAAIAGQGVVAEVANFSKLPGYRTGGTIHIVINNQIGFTTDPRDARSSRYCTDVAKMIESPVFHVNGDDPLAVLYVSELALEYRQTFGEDVFIDILCYRKHGHNESDEPKFTQPVLYKKIGKQMEKSEVLAQQMIDAGELTKAEAGQIRKDFEDLLNQEFEEAKKSEQAKISGSKLFGSTATYQPEYNFDPVETAPNLEEFTHVAKVLTTVPDHIKANTKIARQVKQKWKAFEEDKGIDWAYAESLAFGTLMMEGTPVRLSGQDSERGTFSQRHAAWYDIDTRERYVPLLNLSDNQAQFCVYNSLLSEMAVLGFDYGYSLDYPEMLAMWEAQFGDFCNGAQVIIDQFIASSESKWQRVSGLVMLLPHGYEGMGPEHSSARLERFLQLCAEKNIQVANLTTPAQYFHILRRQMKRSFRKPLVIMSPKSLLRAKEATSEIKDFTDEIFHPILDDPTQPKNAERLIFCSGKVYYDLVAHRKASGLEKKAAIIRIEQLYPLHTVELKEIAPGYTQAKDVVWCQEEPKNMGPWTAIENRLEVSLSKRPRYAGRKPGASPAVGSLAAHKLEQIHLIKQAFADL